jgi:hypothetical protein
MQASLTRQGRVPIAGASPLRSVVATLPSRQAGTNQGKRSLRTSLQII